MKKRKTVGMRIKEAREDKGLSVAKLAKITGIAWRTLYAYESGQVVPSFRKIAKICDILDVSSDWVAMGFEED